MANESLVYACGWTILVRIPTYTYVYQLYTNCIPIVYQLYTNCIPIVYQLYTIYQPYTNCIPTVYHYIPLYTVVYHCIPLYTSVHFFHLHTNKVQPQAYTTFVSNTSMFFLNPCFPSILLKQPEFGFEDFYPRTSEETFSTKKHLPTNLSEESQEKNLRRYPYQKSLQEKSTQRNRKIMKRDVLPKSL